jgi:hypothetical protein
MHMGVEMQFFNHPHGLGESVAEAPQSESARRAIEHYQRTGTFRPADLRRVLGKLRGTEVGPDSEPDWSIESSEETSRR